jgi:hypothetical protein
MGDLTTLHTQAKKLILHIREDLEKLEAMEVVWHQLCVQVDHLRSLTELHSFHLDEQNGSRYGDPSRLARDLRGKHAELQVLGQFHLFLVVEQHGLVCYTRVTVLPPLPAVTAAVS